MGKIAIIANDSNGLWLFRRDLIAALAAGGHQVVLLTPFTGDEDSLRSLGAELIDTPMDRRGTNPLADMKLLGEYKRLLRQTAPQLVITYTIKPNIYGGKAAASLGIPYAANITGLGTAFERGGLLTKLVVTMYKNALRKAKVVFFENSENCRIFTGLGIVPEEKTCVLSGAGVDLEHYSLLPYPAEGTRFLFMGRIMQEKGVDELFAAMERLRGEGEDCTLDLLGFYEEDKYKALIEKYEAQGWLRFFGYQSDVRPYIQDCHCFVLPSWHEGMANTNLEAASCGRPVITSDIPGCREAVEDGVSGSLCKARDAQSLYECLKRFIALDPASREEMGRRGRLLMEQVFDKKKVVARTLERLFD